MMYTDDPELTRFGYYEVNGIRSFSKFEAWQHSNKNFDDVKFVYNEDVFSQYDWSKEPEEDIHKLYAQRAKQLREKYDYIVLMFSGGIDCSVVLNTFLENNVHIDEILVCTTAKVEPKDSLFNLEVFKRAIPITQSLDLEKMGTKFRLVDITDLMKTQYEDEWWLNNFPYLMNSAGTNWNTAVRTHKLKLTIDEHLQLGQSGKKICYLWGLDKPTIKIENGQYAFTVNDNGIAFNAKNYFNKVVLKDQLGNFTDEPFYFSRECPKITIKQSHMVIKAIKDIEPDDPRLISQDDLGNTGPIVIHHRFKYFRFLPKKLVDGAIYPRENLDAYSNDKVKGSIIYTPRDYWWTKSDCPNRYKWEARMQQFVDENDGYYLIKNGVTIQARAVLGKPYCITPVTFKDPGQ